VCLALGTASVGCLLTPLDEDRFAVPLGELRVLGTVPADGAEGVARDAVIDVCFDGLLDPAFVPRAAQLYAGSALFDASAVVLLVAWRPPGERDGIATGRWCPGSVLRVHPTSPLRASTPYRIRLDTSVAGWSGETLIPEGEGWINDRGEPALIVEFTTAPTIAADPTAYDRPAAPPPSAPTLSELFERGGPFDASRDVCSCHREPGPARELVDLTSPARAATTLLREGPERVVIPGRPAESRLLHVTLRDPDGAPLPGPRSGPMPPTESGSDPWSHADVSRVAAWIEAGAPP
jgi:hypothetical protein